MMDRFPGEVDKKESRKIKSRKEGRAAAWFGLGMFGLVGWAVAVPTVAATFLGVWIDSKWPSRYSWTLMLLLIGLLVGCGNGWYWLQKERRAIERSKEGEDG